MGILSLPQTRQYRTVSLSVFKMMIASNTILRQPSAAAAAAATGGYYARASFTTTTEPQILLLSAVFSGLPAYGRATTGSSSTSIAATCPSFEHRYNRYSRGDTRSIFRPLPSSSSSSSSSSAFVTSTTPILGKRPLHHHHDNTQNNDNGTTHPPPSFLHCPNNNKFKRLRSRITHLHAVPPSAAASDTGTLDDYPNDNDDDGKEDPLSIAQNAISVLTPKERTWKRLSPLIELAIAGGYHHSRRNVGGDAVGGERRRRRTVADIGCDHGLLSIALAVSGRYAGVVGVDVSERALEDGAMVSYEKMRHILLSREGGGGDGGDGGDDGGGYRDSSGGTTKEQILDLDSILPVRFRVGDGLKTLSNGEADIICIAGMGVNTMISILTERQQHNGDRNTTVQQQPTGDDNDEKIPLDQVQCERLLLQPTNSRPRNLIKLYRQLAKSGFVLDDERIVYLNSRWYVTCAFDRIDYDDDDDDDDGKDGVEGNDQKAAEYWFPGAILAARGDHEFHRYADHHTSWLEGDLRRNATLDGDDARWLERIQSER